MNKVEYFKPQNIRTVCPGKRTSFPISKLDPTSWINGNNNNYSIFMIDGFIIDKNKKPNGNFTRIELNRLNKNYFDSDESINFIIDRIKVKYFKKIKANILFSDIIKVDHLVVVTLNNFPQGYPKNFEGILIIDFLLQGEKLICNNYEKHNLDSFEKIIYKYRGFSFKYVKNLLSSPSYLSCYFNNNTKNPFPGDLDAGIIDIKSKKIVSLIEYKTHNIDTPTENEHIGKYGKQDWRRFQVLFNLKTYIESIQDNYVKLFYVPWGTREISNHKLIKIDLIEPDKGNGKIVDSKLLERPKFGAFSNNLFSKLI